MSFYTVSKRALDVGISALGLLALSPVMAALAVVVKRDSPGPVLYRRRVMARGGGQFDALKFRTMRVDGDALLAGRAELREALAREHKLRDDPRITRSGAWMRRLSLDELPQLVNVLRGQMSLVGPRMISPPELSRYGDRGGELLSVRPGMTGLWQISGRSELAADERVRLDIEYVRTRGLGLDLALLARTLPAVLSRRGAR